MNKRDLQIIKGLERFRVLSRDDIVDLYFSSLKRPVNSANAVLKRLARDKQIEVSKEFSPYVYLPYNSIVKKNSTKIPHFLKIVDTYKHLIKHFSVSKYIVEPKYRKGLAEPDIYTVIDGKPVFIEIQRNVYSDKVMNEKVKRYEALYHSDVFKQFPTILMITDVQYSIDSDDIYVVQIQSIHEFINDVKGVKSAPKDGVKIKVAK